MSCLLGSVASKASPVSVCQYVIIANLDRVSGHGVHVSPLSPHWNRRSQQQASQAKQHGLLVRLAGLTTLAALVRSDASGQLGGVGQRRRRPWTVWLAELVSFAGGSGQLVGCTQLRLYGDRGSQMSARELLHSQ